MAESGLSCLNEMKCNEYASNFSDHDFLNAMNFNESFKDDGDFIDDSDFSDLVLKYINQMLMEDDIEEKNCMFQESSAALIAAEKSFYNVLMVKDHNQDQDHDHGHGQDLDHGQVQDPDHGQVQDLDHGQVQDHDHGQVQDHDHGHGQDQDHGNGQDHDHGQVQDHDHGQVQDHDHGQVQDHDHGQVQYHGHGQDQDQDHGNGQDHDHGQVQDHDHGQDQDYGQVQVQDRAAEKSFNDSNSDMGRVDLTCDVSESSLLPITFNNFDSQSRFHPSYSLFSSSCTSNMVDGFVVSPVSILSFPDMFTDNQFTMRFHPNDRILDNVAGTCVVLDQKMVKTEKRREISSIPDHVSRGKKNPYSKDLVEDGRFSKQSAVFSEPTVRSKMFDDVLLCDGPKTHPSRCEFVRKETASKGQPGQLKGSNGVKARVKKQKEVVDLRSLLTLCAQSVSTNDQRGVTDLLKQIREHASPTGDGMQRLAHYFSAGLEARMAGSGTGIYKALLSRPTSAVDVLKAYHLFLSCFPFTKVSHFVSNKTIMCVAQNKTKLHIIDFGILYGFQWPCLIQRLSTRPGGPPELRITGIDFPCPGFRPAQRVEETGRRLANYAETFGVRFKFKAIAQKWESIKIEDLELDNEETLVVNCGYRFRNLLDETAVMVDSPRDKVLKLIRKMNPDIFIQGIVNGSYSAPFFLTRFREALFFFSSLFDMLDATVDRLTEERMLVEKTIWGREAMNVIACEGGERIERPETYKQWQVRNKRAGFRQVVFDQEILKTVKDKAVSAYHKDFVVDEDGYWMLQGWKGRVLYAISAWKPAY